jgi:hypothetical protein
MRDGFMKYGFEMTVGSVIYTPKFMKIGAGFQVIQRVWTQQCERLQYWYYCWDGFMKYTIEMASGGMTYTKFHKDRFRLSDFVGEGCICRHAPGTR